MNSLIFRRVHRSLSGKGATRWFFGEFTIYLTKRWTRWFFGEFIALWPVKVELAKLSILASSTALNILDANWPFEIGWNKDFIIILTKFHASLIGLRFCGRISEQILLNFKIDENATIKIKFYSDCSIYVSRRPNFIFYNSCKILDFALYFNNSTILL